VIDILDYKPASGNSSDPGECSILAVNDRLVRPGHRHVGSKAFKYCIFNTKGGILPRFPCTC
jgi:hypothetical protein